MLSVTLCLCRTGPAQTAAVLLAVPGPGDLGPGAAATAETGAFLRTASGQSSPSRATGNGSAKNGSVGSERRGTSDGSESEAHTGAAPGPDPGPESVTTTTAATTAGPSSATQPGNTGMNITTSSRETTLSGRDKRLLLPGVCKSESGSVSWAVLKCGDIHRE